MQGVLYIQNSMCKTYTIMAYKQIIISEIILIDKMGREKTVQDWT